MNQNTNAVHTIRTIQTYVQRVEHHFNHANLHETVTRFVAHLVE